MIRQLVNSGSFLRYLGLPPQFLAPASKVVAARLSSDRYPPPPTRDDTASSEEKIRNEIRKRMFDQLVQSNKIVVFMKGTPKSPRCGFSNAVVQIFRMHGVQYDAHDVLANDELREGIKTYTDWPTIPQVFIDGEFVGGCDILLEMHQNGELVEHLKKAGVESELLRLQKEMNEKEKKKPLKP